MCCVDRLNLQVRADIRHGRTFNARKPTLSDYWLKGLLLTIAGFRLERNPEYIDAVDDTALGEFLHHHNRIVAITKTVPGPRRHWLWCIGRCRHDGHRDDEHCWEYEHHADTTGTLTCTVAK
mgnify:CR=1 FL=1